MFERFMQWLRDMGTVRKERKAMKREQIIRELRGMLHRIGITQDEVDVLCAAIRELGGTP
jgi:tRNA C32,U32 (ribose-2'-O)-methylase TrmJ